nr:hypothetical protein [Campylobacter helveticus]
MSASIYEIFANFILMELAGAKAVAAYSIILYIDNFITMLTLVMCEAMQPDLSYHFAQKNDKEFLEFSTQALYIFSFVFLICWFNILVSCMLTAFNKAHFSLILSLISNLFAPLIFVLILSNLIGLNGVWMSPFLADFCVFFLAFYFLKKV